MLRCRGGREKGEYSDSGSHRPLRVEDIQKRNEAESSQSVSQSLSQSCGVAIRQWLTGCRKRKKKKVPAQMKSTTGERQQEESHAESKIRTEKRGDTRRPAHSEASRGLFTTRQIHLRRFACRRTSSHSSHSIACYFFHAGHYACVSDQLAASFLPPVEYRNILGNRCVAKVHTPRVSFLFCVFSLSEILNPPVILQNNTIPD